MMYFTLRVFYYCFICLIYPHLSCSSLFKCFLQVQYLQLGYGLDGSHFHFATDSACLNLTISACASASLPCILNTNDKLKCAEAFSGSIVNTLLKYRIALSKSPCSAFMPPMSIRAGINPGLILNACQR